MSKKEEVIVKDLVTDMVTKKEEIVECDIEDMPLNTLGDYLRYNAKARAANRRLKLCRYPIKQCPAELHPQERIVLSRNDKNTGSVHVHLSNEMIHFDQKLEPGKTYDLPRVVVEHLSNRGYAVWKWYTLQDGSKETRVSHYEPRFSIRNIYR